MNENIRFSLIKKLLRLHNKQLHTNLVENRDLLHFHWFEIEREQFLFVFRRRANNKFLRPKIRENLKEILKKFEKSTEELILSNSISNGKIDVLVYTNVDINILFGVLEFDVADELPDNPIQV